MRTTEPLLWYAGAGHEIRYGPHYHYDAATRQESGHLVLQYTIAGCGFYRRHTGQRILLPAGKAFIDWIPGPFEYGWAGDAPGAEGKYEQVFLCLQGDLAVQWMKQLARRHGHVLDFGDDSAMGDSLLGFLDWITEHGNASARDRYVVSSHLYGLLMRIMSALSRSKTDASPLVARTLAIIEKDANDPGLNIVRIARALDCSREHLTREFRQTVGVAPIDYLTRHRVRQVAAELRAGHTKLETIARRCGFTSAAYLCRVFRKVVGATPTQFRERPWLVVP